MVQMHFPICTDNAPSKSQYHHLSKLSTRQEKPSFELLVRIVQETSKTLQAIDIALGCPPDMENTSLFLKMACISDRGPRDP